MTYISDRITIDENICNGRPTIRGMRITVQTVLEYLLAGEQPEEILRQYPMLETEDITACREFAIKLLDRSYTIRKVA